MLLWRAGQTLLGHPNESRCFCMDVSGTGTGVDESSSRKRTQQLGERKLSRTRDETGEQRVLYVGPVGPS